MGTIHNEMITFKIKDGRTVSYDTPFDMTEDYEGVVKFRIVREGQGEGPWVRLHPDDIADHTTHAYDSDNVRLAVMSNDCLCGVPWLAIIPYRMRGHERPECVMEELIDLESAPVFAHHETGELITAEAYGGWRSAAAEEERKRKEGPDAAVES